MTKWSKARRQAFNEKKQHKEQLKAEPPGINIDAIKKEISGMSNKEIKEELAQMRNRQLTESMVAQTPSVDVRSVEERAWRRGLITALECIIRELR